MVVAAEGRSAAVLAALADARTAAGCDPLTADAGLAAAAGAHDAAMAAAGVPNAAGAGGALVDRGDADAADVVARWLAGPAADVLLDCGRSRLGAAELAGDGGPWWTAVLS